MLRRKASLPPSAPSFSFKAHLLPPIFYYPLFILCSPLPFFFHRPAVTFQCSQGGGRYRPFWETCASLSNEARQPGKRTINTSFFRQERCVLHAYRSTQKECLINTEKKDKSIKETFDQHRYKRAYNGFGGGGVPLKHFSKALLPTALIPLSIGRIVFISAGLCRELKV